MHRGSVPGDNRSRRAAAGSTGSGGGTSCFDFATGPALWGDPKRLIFKGRASTELSFLGFGTGPVLAGQSGSFLKAGLVQNRHFLALVLVTACQVMSHHVTSRLDILLTEEILHHLRHHMYCNPRAPNLTFLLVKCFPGLAQFTEILHHLAKDGTSCVSQYIKWGERGCK